MSPARWKPLLRSAVDAGRAARGLDDLTLRLPGWMATASTATLAPLVRVLGASPFLAELIQRHPEWVPEVFDPESLPQPHSTDYLRHRAAGMVRERVAAGDPAGAFRELRLLKAREHLRIAARDLAGLARVEETTRELSDTADACLGALLAAVQAQLAGRLGSPWHRAADGTWHPIGFCIIGLGKLGGRELNYSSDVDLIFVYGEEGWAFRTPPGPATRKSPGALAAHEYFKRLVTLFTEEVRRPAPEGQLYRVDLRLRPEGAAGPVARALESYENYYAQWGQTWERLMLQKARPVGGNRELGSEFIETIQPFRFPRSLSDRLLGEIAQTRRRIETEAVQGDAERDVKRGRGGIREIEFVVQTLQLLNGGRQPFLQSSATLPALGQLATYRIIRRREADALGRAYRFWRAVEHRLQMEHNLQTHALPADEAGRRRIARLMGFRTTTAFDRARERQAATVRSVYRQYVGTSAASAGEVRPGLPGDFQREQPAWLASLARHGFRDPAVALRRLQEFVRGPGWAHVSARTEELGRSLLPLILSLCPGSPHPRHPESRVRGTLSDPDRVLVRLDAFTSAYGARAPLYETWASHPPFLELLLWLFDRSEHLAEVALRHPDLVEDLLLGGRLRRSKAAAETRVELRHGAADADQAAWIGRYHQAEQMRIGLRSILDLADWEQTSGELSALAEACLQHALEVIPRPRGLTGMPLAAIALGKLGGAELSFGSDLDLMFVTRLPPARLPPLQRLAAGLVGLLGSQPPGGAGFTVDLRLRPDGEKGLLVNTVEACINYCLRRARLWEIQALSRARWIGGDEMAGRDLVTRLQAMADLSRPHPSLAAWSPEWLGEVEHMRERIERERTPAGQEELAFKTGAGGLVEAEFLAQAWCLHRGWAEPNTLRALERGIADGLLPRTEGRALLEAYRELRRIELVLRRWSFQPESLLPTDDAARQRVAIRCGFATGTDLLRHVAAARQAIRHGCQLAHRILS